MFETPTPFITFGFSHILVILTTLLVIIAVNLTKNFHINYQSKISKIITYSGLLFFPVHFLVYFFWIQTFDIRWDLPMLQICGLTTLAICFYLLTKKHYFFNILFFWGIGAMLASFFTPALKEDFPHIYFWLFWISHLIIVYALTAIIVVNEEKISYSDLWVSILSLAGYCVLIYPFNLLTSSNYAFLISKPESIHFGNFLGQDFDISPWYLIPASVVIVVLFHLIYLSYKLTSGNKLQAGYQIPLSQELSS